MPKFSFSKKAIDSLPLPPAGKRANDTDTKTPGLELRVTSKGTKTFSCQRWIKDAARPERVTLGRYPTMTIEQARKAALRVNGAIAEGNNPAAIRRQLRGEPTLSELFHDYLERHAKKQKRTWSEDQRCFDRYISPSLGRRKLSSLARRDFATLHANISRTAPVQANRVLSLCSRLFSWALEASLWEGANPVAGIKRNPERERDRFLQASELPRFFQALAAEPSDTVRDYILTSLLTGARRSNVLSMRWEELDLEAGEWRIPDSKTKNGQSQLVTMPPQLVTVLVERRRHVRGPWVFPGTGKVGHFADPKKGWDRIKERAQALGIIHALAPLEEWQDPEVTDAAEMALYHPDQVVKHYAAQIHRHELE
ncbi:MAG: tyrosine-type recombinase/integrase, partial [Billgrantia desiderata]